MGKIIAVTNQKGGVGKTTTAVNLTAALTRRGKKVLLCDFDPQSNASSGLGCAAKNRRSIYDVLVGETPAKDAILTTRFGPLSLLPSSIQLAGAEIELLATESDLKGWIADLEAAEKRFPVRE